MTHNSTEYADNQEPLWRLTPEDIQEFRRLIKETTGEELTDEEAWNRATELVALYRMFLGPLPEDPDVTPSSPGPRLPGEPGPDP